jgi:hypothetical protein
MEWILGGKGAETGRQRSCNRQAGRQQPARKGAANGWQGSGNRQARIKKWKRVGVFKEWG